MNTNEKSMEEASKNEHGNNLDLRELAQRQLLPYQLYSLVLLYISVILLQSFPSEVLISPFIDKKNKSLIFKLKEH